MVEGEGRAQTLGSSKRLRFVEKERRFAWTLSLTQDFEDGVSVSGPGDAEKVETGTRKASRRFLVSTSM